MTDITDALRAALYAMPIGVAILDRSGNLLFSNTIAETIMPDRVEPGDDTLSAALSRDARSRTKYRFYDDPRREIVYRYIGEFCVAFIGARDVWLDVYPSAFGLTKTEEAVLEYVVNGQSPAEAADNLGIKHATVSKHLKSIFPKVGVNRQADLVRVILTGPAGVQWP